MNGLKFQPRCLVCSSDMEMVEALGLAMEGGELTCKSCGEGYSYRILNRHLILTRTSVPKGFVGSVEETIDPSIEPAAIHAHFQGKSGHVHCSCCSAIFPIGDTKCPSCNAAVVDLCRACGKPLTRNAGYCKSCGEDNDDDV